MNNKQSILRRQANDLILEAFDAGSGSPGFYKKVNELAKFFHDNNTGLQELFGPLGASHGEQEGR